MARGRGVRLQKYKGGSLSDVATFDSTSGLSWKDSAGRDPTPTLVKRLVGTPGDTLYMRSGLLYLNGIAQRQGYGINTQVDPAVASSVDPLFDWQKKVGLKSSRFGAAPTQPTHDDWGPFVVPPHRLFMMGDSRYNSKDSRYFGPIHRDIIVRFGRFPHRNAVLGRVTTPEEQAFLDDGGFGG